MKSVWQKAQRQSVREKHYNDKNKKKINEPTETRLANVGVKEGFQRFYKYKNLQAAVNVCAYWCCRVLVPEAFDCSGCDWQHR